MSEIVWQKQKRATRLSCRHAEKHSVHVDEDIRIIASTINRCRLRSARLQQQVQDGLRQAVCANLWSMLRHKSELSKEPR